MQSRLLIWAIAYVLITCLQDPQEAKMMGDRDRQFILKHYTWDAITTQLIDVYGEILGDLSMLNACQIEQRFYL